MKKILALVLALMMVLGMVAAFAEGGSATPASAPTPEGATADGSISIEGFDKGDVVNFFQVIEWGWINNNTTGGWKLTSAFAGKQPVQDVLDKINAGIVENGVKKPYQLEEADVNAIVTAILDNNIAASFTETAASDTITKTVNPGMYIALVTPVTPGTIYNPIVVSSDYKAGNGTNEMDDLLNATVGKSAKVKKKPNEVKKTTSDSDSAIAQAIDSYVGQDVDFYVETYIPSYLTSYKNPTFYLEDYIPTTGVTYNANSIEIKLNNADPAGTEYVLTEKPNGKNGYKIVFNSDYLTANRAPVKLNIHYTGKVTSTAEFNINRDTNDVTVVYTNGPNDELTALRDETNHYTFSIGAKAFGQSSEEGKTYELVKVAADENGKPIVEKRPVSSWYTQSERHPLADAEFGLYTDEDCTTLYTNDIYPSGATFKTKADGVITFKGLAAGTYYIKEIKAPNDYVRDNRTAKVEIEAHYKTLTVDAKDDTDIVTGKTIKVAGYETEVLDWYKVKVNNVSVYDSQNDQYVTATGVVETKYEFDNQGPHTVHMTTTSTNDSELVNPKGVELPSTGGMGTTILYIGGSILVLAAVILLVTKRRMKVED